MLQILSQVDRSHASCTQLPLDAIPALQGSIQAADSVGWQEFLGLEGLGATNILSAPTGAQARSTQVALVSSVAERPCTFMVPWEKPEKS